MQPATTGHGTASALAVSGSPSAMSSSLVASASVSARPTSWPLPYASYYVNMPPAGASGGPTKPCAPHVDWGKSKPLPAGSGRAGGIGCSDFTPVRYPVCTEEQVARAKRLDAVLAPGAPRIVSIDTELLSFRGYLRRDLLWAEGDFRQLRLEALSPGGTCDEISITDWPKGTDLPPLPTPQGVDGLSCRGDPALTCCMSELLAADEEVVFETGPAPGQMCVVRSTARQDSVAVFLRSEERAFTRPGAPMRGF